MRSPRAGTSSRARATLGCSCRIAGCGVVARLPRRRRAVDLHRRGRRRRRWSPAGRCTCARRARGRCAWPSCAWSAISAARATSDRSILCRAGGEERPPARSSSRRCSARAAGTCSTCRRSRRELGEAMERAMLAAGAKFDRSELAGRAYVDLPSRAATGKSLRATRRPQRSVGGSVYATAEIDVAPRARGAVAPVAQGVGGARGDLAGGRSAGRGLSARRWCRTLHARGPAAHRHRRRRRAGRHRRRSRRHRRRSRRAAACAAPIPSTCRRASAEQLTFGSIEAAHAGGRAPLRVRRRRRALPRHRARA